MAQTDDLSRYLAAFDQDTTLVVVVEMSQSNWLAAALVPGLDRQPLKKMAPDQTTLLRLVERWRDEAVQACGDRCAVVAECGSHRPVGQRGSDVRVDAQ